MPASFAAGAAISVLTAAALLAVGGWVLVTRNINKRE
jgi:hypothetical protein